MKSPYHSGSLKEQVMGPSVIHVPNIQDEAGIAGFAGIEKYKLRMLAPLNPGDSAIMPSNTRTDLEDLFKYYDQLGIAHLNPRDVAYLHNPDQKRLSSLLLEQRKSLKSLFNGTNSQILDPFILSESMERSAQYLGKKLKTTAAASETVNNKYICQNELRKLGVSVPPGKLVFSTEEAKSFAQELKNQGYEFVSFKLVRAASGMGVFKVTPEELVDKCREYRNEMSENGILIDGWISKPKASSPNIQFNIADQAEDDVFICATDQILDENNAHRGNIYSEEIMANPRLKSDLPKIREWTRSQGYRGIIGVDFLITTDGTPYFMEINARVNGSTPGALLVDKLVGSTTNRPWGVQNNIRVPVGSSFNDFVKKLDKEGLTFSPEKRVGVLPTNNSAIADHQKVMVIIIDKTADQVRTVINQLYVMHQQTLPKNKDNSGQFAVQIDVDQKSKTA